MDTEQRLKQLQGRVNAIEGIAMTAVGILLSQAPNDPDKQKAVALLNFLKQTVLDRIPETNSEDCEAETREALDDLLSKISENLGLLRPKDNQ